MNALRRLWASDSGQALVESALCLPVLILFLAAVIDLGLLLQFDTILASSARAGAQYGSQNATNAADTRGMQTAATNDASIVSATASSYYKCADGTAPPTSPVLTMTGTASIDCSANHNAARAGLRLRANPARHSCRGWRSRSSLRSRSH
jgi:Flp pilus assembly protein TadG